MGVSTRHVLSQGPVLSALARTAARALLAPRLSGTAPSTPGPWLEDELPPRPARLVRDYVRHVGGDPAWYRQELPPHLFPQWAFPLAARALEGLPYPLARVVNAGCRIERHAALPPGEPLHVRARLVSIDDDGSRAILTTQTETGTRSSPGALSAELRAYVPLARRVEGAGRGRPARVPATAREIAFVRLRANAGLEFAKLTGDFNPIHWLGPHARAAGFRGCILHGFATLARAVEALVRARLAGDPRRLTRIDVRFTRPLVLPAAVGIYLDGGAAITVGDAPGGRAYLEGHYETETPR